MTMVAEAEPIRVLVDTNVIIDALAAREPFRVEAEAILLLAAEERMAGFVTGSSMTDIYYLIRRQLSHREALDALRMLMHTLSVVSVGEDECLDAMQTGMGDFEDAVAAVCADRVRADFIVTRDEEFAGKGYAIPVAQPAEILKRVE
jgi:predicted nucleic acid-binding protein